MLPRRSSKIGLHTRAQVFPILEDTVPPTFYSRMYTFNFDDVFIFTPKYCTKHPVLEDMLLDFIKKDIVLTIQFLLLACSQNEFPCFQWLFSFKLGLYNHPSPDTFLR